MGRGAGAAGARSRAKGTGRDCMRNRPVGKAKNRGGAGAPVFRGFRLWRAGRWARMAREDLPPMDIDLSFLLDLLRIPSVTDDVPQVNRSVAAMRGWLEARGVFCETEAMPDGREFLDRKSVV